MFRNPVYDLLIIVPALCGAALLIFFITTHAVEAHDSSGPSHPADKEVTTVVGASTSLQVAYTEPGRLLGFFPVVLTDGVKIESDGSVTIMAPWYRLLSVTEQDHLRTALEVRIHALLTSEGYLDSMPLSPQTQSEIVGIIRELLT